MPSRNPSELLIRIGADPSNAEQSIGEFRARFTQNLAGINAGLQQWSSQSVVSFLQVDRTTQDLADHFKVNADAMTAMLERNRQMAQLWRTQVVASLMDVLNVSENLSTTMLQGFMQFDNALGVNVANAAIWQKSIGEAFTKAAVQSIAAIAQESLVRAIQATALGFYLLAIQDYSGAASAFESAALYGAVGGAAALAGRALAPSTGTASSGSSTTGATRRASTGASTSTSSLAAPEAQKTVQVIFQGPVYGGQAGIDELVRHITQAVTERDVNLVAYTVVRQPAVRE